ncbi:MAG: sugar nucleotide-binding protein [Chloroflexi bacterium]|nr:sugar nucleotide-binding protein [Chloroflexota bacterium]
MKVIVLGASGMLGSMVLDYLSRDLDVQLIATARRRDLIHSFESRLDNVEWRRLDAGGSTVKKIVAVLGDAAWAVNAIGVIKPYIHDDNAAEVERAVNVNARFPHLLAHAAEETGCRVLQIATDCVYSGRGGNYTEKDEHDPLDVYGKTKSLGEVYSGSVYHLRCSIIGPEPKGHISLLDWFLGQSRHASVNGYTNHRWNGVTTLHFAKLCQGIIKRRLALPHVQHVIPSGSISKAEMLGCFAREYKRGDITITPTNAKVVIDRTLSTVNDSLNRQLWAAAGYATPPSVPEMVAEMAKYEYRFPHEVSR